MDVISIYSTLEKRHSKKKNSDYYVISIKITDTYEKLVFIDKAEQELLKLYYSDEF